MKTRQLFSANKRRIPFPVLILSSIFLIAILLFAGFWTLSHQSATKNTGGVSTPAATQQNIAVSPLIFGTNLGLFNTNDQVLRSTKTRSLLQQLHLQIIRMPVRSNLPLAPSLQAAQIIKDMGFTPLIILRGPKHANALEENKTILQEMNRIFGQQKVYYEFGNEADLDGVSVTRYTDAWNSIIPQLKPLAPQGHFIGPVNYQYNGSYLRTFLQKAQPQPDEISWHEYTCDKTAAVDVCLSHIDRWTTHISSARSVTRAVLGHELPIMITEWNYAPNATADDGKNSDSLFMQKWTTKAIQTLSANRIFASMQYSCTDTAIPLITSQEEPTTQGSSLQALYQQIIVSHQQPAAVGGSVLASPTVSTVKTPTTNAASTITFASGNTDGWSSHGKSLTKLQNSPAPGDDHARALQLTLTNITNRDYPYASFDITTLAHPPKAGQTITAMIYLASNSLNLRAKLFVVDTNDHWLSSDFTRVDAGNWIQISYTLPTTVNEEPHTLGLQFNNDQATEGSCEIYISTVSWH